MYQQQYPNQYQNSYAQQGTQQQDHNTANLQRYQMLIPTYLQSKAQAGTIQPHVANQLYTTLMSEVQSGVARQAIMNYYPNRLAPDNDLLAIIDNRASYYINSMYAQYGNSYQQPLQQFQQGYNPMMPNQMPNNQQQMMYQQQLYQQLYQQQLAQQQAMQNQMLQQQRAAMYNQNTGMYNNPSADGASLAEIYGTGKPAVNNISAFSPVPDRTVTPNPTYHSPQPVVTKQKQQSQQPAYNQTATSTSYNITEQPSKTLNHLVEDIPLNFMGVEAKKMKVEADENGVHTEKQLNVFDTHMKYPVENLKQAKEDIEAANIPTDQDTVTLATVDEVVLAKGDNEALTKSFNVVNKVLSEAAKKTNDMCKIALIVMKAIRSQGEEFIDIIEPKICEEFNNVLRIVLHRTTKEGRSYRESDVEVFEDIEALLARVDVPDMDFPDIGKYKLAMITCINASILSVFTGAKRTLDVNNEDDRQIILEDSRLPVKIEGKPYRLLKSRELTEEQTKELNEKLKQIFAFKVRRKVIYHNNRFDFGFTDPNDYDPKSFKMDAASKKLLTSIIDKAEAGHAYLVDITKPDQFIHPIVVAENFNKELEARRV